MQFDLPLDIFCYNGGVLRVGIPEGLGNADVKLGACLMSTCLLTVCEYTAMPTNIC